MFWKDYLINKNMKIGGNYLTLTEERYC